MNLCLPERTILSNCELRRVLGQGGGGISYMAFDKVLERPVVIKEHFPLGLCLRHMDRSVRPTDAELYERSLSTFCREARILAGLNHPNVVKVFDIFEAAGTAYIIMEYAEGETLTEWLPKHAACFAEVNGVLCSLLHTLEYLHGNNILHRDVKPANIIITESGHPILIDFGCAHLGTAKHTITMVGSPGYSAPEQFTPHGNTGPWSDLYGLAQSFLHLLPDKQKRVYPRRFLKAMQQAALAEPTQRPQSAAQWLAAINSRRYRWPLFAFAAVLLVAAAAWYICPPLSPPAKSVPQASAQPDTKETPEELHALLQAEFERYSAQLAQLATLVQNGTTSQEEYQTQRGLYEEQYLRNVEDIKRMIIAPSSVVEPLTMPVEEKTPVADEDADDGLGDLVRELEQHQYETAFERLCQKRLLTILKQIMAGAPVDTVIPNANGTTALHNACGLSHVEIVRWLVEHGADLNAKTAEGASVDNCVGGPNAKAINTIITKARNAK